MNIFLGVWDKDITAEIFFSSFLYSDIISPWKSLKIIALEKLALTWTDFRPFSLNHLNTIWRCSRCASSLDESTVSSYKYRTANSSLIPTKQFSIKCWNSAEEMKAVSGWLSASKHIQWYGFFCKGTENHFFRKICQGDFEFGCLSGTVFEFSDLKSQHNLKHSPYFLRANIGHQ